MSLACCKTPLIETSLVQYPPKDVSLTTPDFDQMLFEQYRDKIGVRGDGRPYPKSHWQGCQWVSNPERQVVMPTDTPARLISCNGCLIERNYIRIVPCDPHMDGWMTDDGRCSKCDYGLDHETWLRVGTIGVDVEKVLKRLDPDAYHPVTWMETGLIPFTDPGADARDNLFDSYEELERYYENLLRRNPAFARMNSTKGQE